MALPTFLPWFLGAAAIGAVIGTSLSLTRLDKKGVLRVLGVVLGVAAIALVK
jgi:hypothetical protein